MLEPIKKTAREMIGEGQVAEAIEYLLENIQPGRAVCNDLIQRQASLKDLQKREQKNLVSPANANQTRAQVTEAVLAFINELEAEDLRSARPSAGELLHDWHRLTCDRTVQNNNFQKIRREKESSRTRFFYLYGLDRHAHEALVERFAYDLQGVLRSHLNPELAPACKVEQEFNFSLIYNDDPEEYQTEILANLFSAFGLVPDTYGPLLESSLKDLWKNSPRLQQLTARDYVCCYLSIPEMDWDSEITPAVVRWFIDTFCGNHLPKEAPTFYFFFGIEFEEEDTGLREEVEAAIRAGGRIQMLPELNIVEKRDLKRWFNTYRKFMPDRRQRDELYQEYFGEQEEAYMEDVIRHLHRLIDKLNNP